MNIRLHRFTADCPEEVERREKLYKELKEERGNNMTPSKEAMVLAEQLKAVFQIVYAYKEGREKQMADAATLIGTALAQARLEGAKENQRLRAALSWYGYGANYCQIYIHQSEIDNGYAKEEDRFCPVIKDLGKLARNTLGVEQPYDEILVQGIAALDPQQVINESMEK